MAHLLVSIGTDGPTEWVKTPDGQRFNLGPHSMLSFVSRLAKNSRIARSTLDAFLRGEETMLRVDEDKMWDILAPRRARWASDGSFMSHDQRHTAHLPSRTSTMDTLPKILTATESIVEYCNKQASAGKPISRKAFEDLDKIARLLTANQSDNSHFYGMPAAPKPDRPEVGFANEQTSSAGMVDKAAGELTFDTYEANLKVAEQILAQAKKTVATIQEKVAAGKRFNAKKAHAAVVAVTNRVASICEDKTVITEKWASDDLKKLAAESERIYRLFHPKA